MGNSLSHLGDLRRPRRIVGSSWIVELNRGAVIGEQDLARRKRQKVAIERAIVLGIRRIWSSLKVGSVPLVESSGRAFVRTSHHQDFAVGLDRCRAIGDADVLREFGAGAPGFSRGIVDGSVAGTAGV